MPDIWMDVDTALAEVPINKVPIVLLADGTTIDAGMVYNEAGLDLNWNFITAAGAFTQTNVTPTDTGGAHDFVAQGNGMYTIEIPASGGTIDNDTEGVGWFTGESTVNLAWASPTIGFRAAALNDALIDGGDTLDVNMTQILGHLLTQSGTQLADGFEKFFNVATPTGTVNSLADAVPGAAGGGFIAGTNAATTVTTALTTTFTGNLTGDVGGNVDGTVAGVTPDAAGTCATQSEVATECADALTDIKLDHLIHAAAAEDEVADNSVIARLAATEGDWSEFDDENHSLEAIRVRGDDEWTTGAGGSAPTVGEIRTEMEVNGGKLDHLWEMTEDDSGIRRYTENALEEAPSGEGGDATEAKQDTLLAVIGALDNAAAAGQVTSADTLMQYIKQLINILIGTDGIGTFPAESAPGNGVSLSEVIRAIHADVTGLNGSAMVGTNGANTVEPDPAGTAATPAEVATALTNIGLDHLLSTAVTGTDITDDSIFAQLVSKSATADWDDFDNTTDALQALADKIVAAAPQDHLAASSTDTTGTIDSGTYADTATINTTYWQMSPEGSADGDGFGLNQGLVFSVGTGLDRIPDSVHIVGYLDSSPVRDVDVWAYNYTLAGWDALSNSATNIQDASSNQSYQYSGVNQNHIQTSDGEMRIRFTTTSTTTGDNLYIDHVSVSSVAAEAAGLTADSIQQAVWARADSGHDENTLGYNVSKFFLAKAHPVSVTSASQFTVGEGVTTNDAYNGMLIMIEDKTDDHYEVRRIVDYIGATREVFVDRAFSFTPVTDDDVYLFSGGYADVNTTHVGGTAQTANDNSADINTLISNQGNWATATSVDLNADAIKAVSYDESTAFPLRDDDAGSTYIARTGADSDTLEDISDEIAGLNNISTAQVNAEVDTALNTAIPAAAAGSINDYIRRTKYIVCNKMEIDETGGDAGDTRLFNDAGAQFEAEVVSAFSSDSTTTTRKKLL